jgi:hypothetical protein
MYHKIEHKSYPEHRMVDCESARELLKCMHPEQRKRIPKHIDVIVRQYLTQNFCEDMNDAICINTRGELQNGQNRLFALIEAAKTKPDISVRMLFLLDQDPDAFPYMDGDQVLRDAAFRLTLLRDEERSILKKYISIVRFAMREVYHLNPKMVIQEIDYYVSKHIEILNWVTDLEPEDKKCFIGTEFVCAMIEMYFIDPIKAKEFRTHVVTGINLPARHPALTLRNRLTADNHGQPRKKEIYYKCIRAMKEYLAAGEAGQIYSKSLTIDDWDDDIKEMLKSMFSGG